MNRGEKILAFVCGFVVPLLFLVLAVCRQPDSQPVEETVETTPVQTLGKEQTLPVLMQDGSVVEMALEDYLTGVVLGEMPASFPEEALKAQAVVARTYAVKRHTGSSKHENAAVCTEPACCQCYVDVQDYLAEGGSQESVDKISRAVADTAAMVLTYQGELIDATYFSCSGGSTEAAVAVWGADIPYLQAVESPGEEEAAHFTDQVSFSSAAFADKLGISGSADPADWFGSVSYTQGGGVESMEICGTVYKGTELRALLGLRSTAFTVRVDGNTITIDTRGFGHRVGMSQYGAQAMAQQGSSFEEILAHYYQGTSLKQWSQ